MADILTLVKISRPGLWLVFIWLYLWPTGGSRKLLNSGSFWFGLIYCTFPLNLLVYGMNDLVDEDVDKKNNRKGNFIYGAKTTRAQREGLWSAILLLNGIPLLLLGFITGDLMYMIMWLLAAVCVNFLYNNKPFQLSRKCPYELPTMIAGHFLIPLLSSRLNDVPMPSWESWLFHALLLSRSHIWLEFADILCDEKEGKRTIAVVLGHKLSLRLVLLLTALEAAVGYWLLNSLVLACFSLFGILVFYLSATAKGVKEEKVHVSISQSLVGVVLMCFLWYTKVLV